MTREERLEELRGQWSSKNPGPFDEAKSSRKYWWECPQGHSFEAFYGNRLNKGSNCRFCYYQRAPDSDEVIARRKEIEAEYSPRNEEPFRSITSYARKKVWWTCPEHGDYLATPANRIIRKSNCKECYLHRLRTSWPVVTKPFSDHPFAKQWSNRNERGPEEYNIGSHARVWWICEKGHEWQNSIDSRVSQNSGCKKCSQSNIPAGLIRRRIAQLRGGADGDRRVVEMWSDRNDEGPENYSLSSNAKVWWTCTEGHPDWKTSVHLVASGAGCPMCANDIKYTRAIERSGSVADWITEDTPQWSKRNAIPASRRSTGSSEKVWWCCPRDERHEWEAVIGDVVRGSRCPRCSKSGTSRAEQEIGDYIESLGLDVIRNSFKVIPPQQVDIYVPSKRFAIEFNGLYWHSEKFVDRNYHRDKWQACKDNNIGLLVVWEDDWKYRRGIVKRMIKAKLGLLTDSIGARKTNLVEIDFQTSGPFLDKYHIQGRTTGTHYLGLYTDRLVAVGVFRKVKDKVYLDRYASSIRVHGGLRKMINYLPYNDFVTFADRSVSDGSLYEKTGWVHDGELAPDYSYICGDAREHKFGYRLKRFEDDPDLLFEPGLTERQLAELNGLIRVYDYGKDRYSYAKSS